MLSFIAPFLAVFAIVIGSCSVYYAIGNIIRSRRPKRVEYTNINYIHFPS